MDHSRDGSVDYGETIKYTTTIAKVHSDKVSLSFSLEVLIDWRLHLRVGFRLLQAVIVQSQTDSRLKHGFGIMGHLIKTLCSE